ncbi:tol-pal system-associated acyl-CoA thioesterase [Undibacterium sp. Di24W]|uniref:tol-pal system-associated acyl-CoA thioesterase n=1 Tax=Undibacterium sp. Di24W TaxID=3413033 RepID=UPI003BEF7F2B
MKNTPITTHAFSWPVRVYYEDTDAGGIVFYANYLKFFERARTEWLRAIGVQQKQMLDEFRALFVVKATAVEYHASARLDDELLVTVQVEKTGRASVVFLQEVWCRERLLTSAKVTACCVDMDQWRPIPIPEPVLKLMNPKLFSTVHRPAEKAK